MGMRPCDMWHGVMSWASLSQGVINEYSIMALVRACGFEKGTILFVQQDPPFNANDQGLALSRIKKLHEF